MTYKEAVEVLRQALAYAGTARQPSEATRKLAQVVVLLALADRNGESDALCWCGDMLRVHEQHGAKLCMVPECSCRTIGFDPK